MNFTVQCEQRSAETSVAFVFCRKTLRPVHDSPRDWDSFATLNSPAPSAPNITHTWSVSAIHLALSVCVLVMFIRVISGSLVSPLPLSALSWVQSTARCLSLLWLIMQHQSLIRAEIRYPIQQYCVSVLWYVHQILMLMLHGDNTRVSQFWYYWQLILFDEKVTKHKVETTLLLFLWFVIFSEELGAQS